MTTFALCQLYFMFYRDTHFTSEVDCRQRLVTKVMYYVSIQMQKTTHFCTFIFVASPKWVIEPGCSTRS